MFATCNFNCICTKADCDFRHNIESIEERRFAANVYGKIPRIKEAITEENADTRKKNCSYGQLCDRSDCGYRHFLNPSTRLIFIANLEKAKAAPPTPPRAAAVTTATTATAAATAAPAPRVATAATAATVLVSARPTAVSSSEVSELKKTVASLEEKVKELSEKLLSLSSIVGKIQLKEEIASSEQSAAVSTSWADASE